LPTWLLPAHSLTAPVSFGAPLWSFFIAGSRVSYGDHALHWWKIVDERIDPFRRRLDGHGTFDMQGVGPRFGQRQDRQDQDTDHERDLLSISPISSPSLFAVIMRLRRRHSLTGLRVQLSDRPDLDATLAGRRIFDATWIASFRSRASIR